MNKISMCRNVHVFKNFIFWKSNHPFKSFHVIPQLFLISFLFFCENTRCGRNRKRHTQKTYLNSDLAHSISRRKMKKKLEANSLRLYIMNLSLRVHLNQEQRSEYIILITLPMEEKMVQNENIAGRLPENSRN